MAIHRGPKGPALEVNGIAAHLEGLEETIIARLIDRAQFCVNERIYRNGESGFTGERKRSLFHLRLLFQEKMDAQFGRFCVPEERPFFTRLPKTKRNVKLLLRDFFSAISIWSISRLISYHAISVWCPASAAAAKTAISDRASSTTCMRSRRSRGAYIMARSLLRKVNSGPSRKRFPVS